MFRGSSFHTIDAKGRINIPSRFRELIRDSGGSGVILAGPGLPEKCLTAYAYNAWEEVEQKILALVEKTPAMKRFMRIFLGNAHDCPFDKQGRVLIPPLLRKYAGLEKDIVLAGVLNRFEVWSLDNWTEEGLKLQEDLKNEEVPQEIARLGL